MALINCKECSTQISDKASSCPKCGCPVANEQDSYVNQGLGEQLKVANTEKKIAKKKKGGCLKPLLIIVFIIFLIALGQGMKGSNMDNNVTPTPTADEIKEAYLAFDEESWDDFKTLYSSHNNFLSWVDAFANGKVTSLEFYDKCKEAKEYFRKASLSFEYGTNKDEKTYLSVFQSVALSNQMAAESLIKYIDNGKTSDLSKSNENIQKAKDALIMISQNRATLLLKAGLTQDEITEKIEADITELETLE